MFQIKYVSRDGSEDSAHHGDTTEDPEEGGLNDETVPSKDLPHFDDWTYKRPDTTDIESQSITDTSVETIEFDLPYSVGICDGQIMADEKLEAQDRVNESLRSKNASQRRQIVFLWVVSLILALLAAVLWFRAAI